MEVEVRQFRANWLQASARRSAKLLADDLAYRAHGEVSASAKEPLASGALVSAQPNSVGTHGWSWAAQRSVRWAARNRLGPSKVLSFSFFFFILFSFLFSNLDFHFSF
jgi:hypothetical protein